MWQLVIAGFFVLATSGCAHDPAKQTSFGDSSSYRTTTIPRTLSIGTTIDATIRSEVSSGTHSADETVEAVVTHNIYDVNRRVVIPEGSTILLTISALESAHDQRRGRISLRGNAITLESTAYPVIARIASTPYVLVAHVMALDPPGTTGAGRTTDRDVVVAAGTPVVLTLTQPLSVWPK